MSVTINTSFQIQNSMQKYNLSIIISTRNRCYLLKKCLDRLLGQKGCESIKYEIIIVDNKSTDKTKEVVELTTKQFKHIRYIFEKTLGLSIARNAGARYAQADIICFIDDDTLPDDYYIYEMYASFSKKMTVCVGGRIVAQWPNRYPPRWFHHAFYNVVGQTSYGSKSRIMEKKEFPFGGNIAFKKEVFFKLGGFNEGLGRKGNNFICGEEIDLCSRLEKQGYGKYYSSKAIVHHIVGEHRTTKEYFRRSIFGKGVTEGYQKLKNSGTITFSIYVFIRLGLLLITALVHFISNFLPINEKFRFFLRCKISWYLGYFYFFRIIPRINIGINE